MHSGSFNNVEQFSSMSLSIHSTVQQKIDKISSLLTCLRRVHYRRMAAGIFIMPLDFLSPCIVCGYS